MIIMEKDLKYYVYSYLQTYTHNKDDGVEIIDLMCEFNCDRATMERAIDEMYCDDTMCVDEIDGKYFVYSSTGCGDIYSAVARFCENCMAGCRTDGSAEGCSILGCPLHPYRMG